MKKNIMTILLLSSIASTIYCAKGPHFSYWYHFKHKIANITNYLVSMIAFGVTPTELSRIKADDTKRLSVPLSTKIREIKTALNDSRAFPTLQSKIDFLKDMQVASDPTNDKHNNLTFEAVSIILDELLHGTKHIYTYVVSKRRVK